MPIESRNPATGQPLHTYDELTPAQLDARLAAAADAFERHRATSLPQRAARLRAVANILESERERLGRIMTLEMGKPIGAAIAEAEKCAWACRYYADNGAVFIADEPVEAGADRTCFIRYEPIGAVLAVMPWNFPFWQVFRFIAPAVMAGNVGLLKHASNVPACALEIEDIMRRAGFEPGVFQTLLIPTASVDGVIRDPRVQAVTLTGSEAAGSAVARTAGETIRKSVLELGGSDPFIVLPSADIDRACEVAVTARTINNGQSCIAAKRFIIHDSVYDEFATSFVARMRALRVGDPLDPETQVGPLATESIRDDLARQVADTVALGGRMLTGGRRIERDGWFFEPTVLADVTEDSPAWREELFGPVATLIRARDIDDVIRIANDTTFGLGASAWTRDVAERDRLIADIQTGMVFINAMVASDPRLPFGGTKRSGYGRELGRIGMHEFVNIKTVVVSRGDSSQSVTE